MDKKRWDALVGDTEILCGEISPGDRLLCDGNKKMEDEVLVGSETRSGNMFTVGDRVFRELMETDSSLW